MVAAVAVVMAAVMAASGDDENYECKSVGSFALSMCVYDVGRYYT